MVIALDRIATEEIARRHRGRQAPALFILITLEGELRKCKDPLPRDFEESPHYTRSWDTAHRMTLQEALAVYNTRSKKTSRPVWAPSISFEDRRASGHSWEPVRLIAHQPTLDRFYPNLRTARLFHIE